MQLINLSIQILGGLLYEWRKSCTIEPQQISGSTIIIWFFTACYHGCNANVQNSVSEKANALVTTRNVQRSAKVPLWQMPEAVQCR